MAKSRKKSVIRAGATRVDVSIEILSNDERRPLVGSFKPASSDPLSPLLCLQPMYVDANQSAFDWPAPPGIGANVTVRRKPPAVER